MAFRRGPVVGLVVLLALLVALPTSSEGSVAPNAASPPPSLVTDRVPLPVDRTVAPILPHATLQLTLTLSPRNAAGLARLDLALNDPGSPEYRHFLTEGEYLTEFAPSPASVAAVSAYFAAHGATTIRTSPDRGAVSFAIPVSGAASALSTSFVQWTGPGGTRLYSATSAPHLPDGLAPLVLALSGLSNAPRPSVSLALRPLAGGHRALSDGPAQFVNDSSSGAQWLYGSDLAQAYHVTPLFLPSIVPNASYGANEAVATILMGGYNATLATDLPPFDPPVVAQYFNDTFPTAWPRPNVSGAPVPVNGVTPPSPGPNGGVLDDSGDQAENSLDLEMAGSMAPASTLVTFYFAARLTDGPGANLSNAGLADAFAQCLSSALSHDSGAARLVAVTNSFGLPDVNDSLWNLELAHAQALGVSVVAASGDQGDAPTDLTNAYQGQWPIWPSTSAFDGSGTIAVGGTSVRLGGRAQGDYNGSVLPIGYDANLSGSVATTAWYDTNGGPGNLTGSEGGVSALYAEPTWQFRSAAQPSISRATGTQGTGQLGRTTPDVAFNGNTTIAYVRADTQFVYFEVLEGTSIASPIFAGMIAEWAAVSGHPFGFLDPELYRIASYYAAHPGPSDPFEDVTSGANYLFGASAGWDAVTGWGSINASAFLAADANSTIAGYVYTGPTPGVPSPSLPPTTAPVNTLLLIAIGVVMAVIVVLLISFRRSPEAPEWRPTVAPAPAPPPPAWDGVGPPPPPPGPPPPPATFSCPYCGAMRPAEPVRCPGCGAW